MEAIAATEAAALAEAEAAAEEAIAAQMLDLGDDQENDDLDPDSNPDSGRVQSNDNSTKTASTLKAGGQNSQNSSLGSLDHDVARENGSANTLKSNGVSRNSLRNASATTQVSSEDYIKRMFSAKRELINDPLILFSLRFFPANS